MIRLPHPSGDTGCVESGTTQETLPGATLTLALCRPYVSLMSV